ncbi:unnamed protein product [Coffea canephora]|uniref:Uncharacterized protein n=1 Tax=Coffea canephora TaxID=49390 RepID=A0A068V2W7_COFCA|nr:unnamed protein product [Coffea canephora]
MVKFSWHVCIQKICRTINNQQRRMTSILVQILSLVLSLLPMVTSLQHHATTGCIPVEREAIITFKEALIDPSNRLASWTGEDCCAWPGVTCNNKTGNVVRLELRNGECYEEGETAILTENSSCLGGKISPSLLKLQHLNYLDLSMNNFQGSLIPEFLGSFEELSYLNLSYASFEGLVPSHLGNLSNLQYLDLYFYLSNNLISGSIPASIGSLRSLEVLDLSYNPINGSISESIGELTGLKRLYLFQDSREGSLSQKHFHRLNNLETLALSSSSKQLFLNVSNDWIPPFNLKFMRITNYQIGDRFPTWLMTQKQLSTLYLQGVGLSETVPNWFWELTPQIIRLDISDNRIAGVLPKSLEFPRGAWVDFSSNRFEGPLPLWSNVSYLSLANNSISGSIPESIGEQMPYMTYLNLSGNFMNGEIPFSMGKMKYLTELYLSNNKFSGEIHDNWGNSQALLIIDLSMNNLSGNLPSSMFLPTYILWLKLNGNNLSGELPFGTTINSTYLSLLDLGDNRFSGKIPRWIGERLTSLTVLRLRNNKFIGSIPQELCSLQMLHVLDFADNDLSGHLPICLGNLSGFHDVMLYHKVPPDVPYAFVPQLVNIIDLSSNHLQGDIPEEVSNLLALGTLNLSRNQFTGKIPKKIGSLSLLETLDLSWNSLSGSIPPAMSHMTSLNFLNLSHNNLSGPIPSTNQFLTFQDPSIYGGNPGLCGEPLPTKCQILTGQNSNGKGQIDDDKNEKMHEKFWLFFLTGLGYALGFCGSLVMTTFRRQCLLKVLG